MLKSILTTILIFLTISLFAQQQPRPQPPKPQQGQAQVGNRNYPEFLIGRGQGSDEEKVKKMAFRSAIVEGLRILLGKNFSEENSQIKKLLNRDDMWRFGKLEGGDRGFQIRRNGGRIEVEAKIRPDWKALEQLLKEEGITQGSNQEAGSKDGNSLPQVIVGKSRDKDQKKAFEQGEKDVLRIAMLRLLGPQSGADSNKLRELWAKTEVKPYITLTKDLKDNVRKIRDLYEVELPRSVNWDLLSQYLKKQGFATVVHAEKQGSENTVANGNLSGGMTTGSQSADWGEVTDDEKNTILKYLDTLSFMVYYNENSTANKNTLKSAVNQANMVLTRSGITVFDIDRVEKAKDDQLKVFEEAKNNTAVNYIQWIAQKLNADVYAQVDLLEGQISEESTDGEPKTIAILTTEIFDSSSGQLLGSFPVNILAATDKANNNLNSLVLNVVEKAMTQAVIQAKEQMQKALVRGMRYDLTIQSTGDSRLMSRFLDKLKENVKQIKVLASSPNEYRYEVYYIGLLSDLESLIYKTTDTIAELINMRLVLSTGKSLTMDSGLED